MNNVLIAKLKDGSYERVKCFSLERFSHRDLFTETVNMVLPDNLFKDHPEIDSLLYLTHTDLINRPFGLSEEAYYKTNLGKPWEFYTITPNILDRSNLECFKTFITIKECGFHLRALEIPLCSEGTPVGDSKEENINRLKAVFIPTT
jgi:hypothetical protein